MFDSSSHLLNPYVKFAELENKLDNGINVTQPMLPDT